MTHVAHSIRSSMAFINYLLKHCVIFDCFRCDALNFSLSKSQKKVIKKFNKYLEDGVLIKNDVDGSETQISDGPNSSGIFIKDRPNINFSKIDSSPSDVEAKISCDLATGEPHCDKVYNRNESTACGKS